MFENLSVTESFKNSISSAIKLSKLSHALIFEGADEATRLSAAREVANALVCRGEEKPCGCCSSCLKASKNSHPDIHILCKESDSTMIKVDAVRQIKAQALIFPNEGAKSVFIISEAQYMNAQAQNALLKIFEEPSSHVCFILTCNSKSSLLDTVISRATSYTLGEEAASGCKDDDKAMLIAAELISSLVKESEFDFLKKTAPFLKDKKLFRDTVERMLSFFRDALILQSGGKELINGEREEIILLKNRFTQKKNFEFTECLKSIAQDIDSSANLNLTVTRFSSVLYGLKIS